MVAAGTLRHRLARTLNAAYGDGLLSEHTFAYRLDLLLRSPVIDPSSLVGDLTLRSRNHPIARTVATLMNAVGLAATSSSSASSPPAALLALDWTGGQTELLVGRHHGCDVVLADPSVSRRHAQLRFRDGSWILRDLDSTNGTTVNGQTVVRCRLLPGDHLTLGDESLIVD
jgi:predicted component of type VI protein secretion system